MSNPLTDVRVRLANLLTVKDLHAFTIVPERVSPPFVYVAPGDPYITEEGTTYGGEIVTCSVGVVVGAGVNEVTAERLDELILTAKDAIQVDDDFFIPAGEVDQPGRVTINGQSHLATTFVVQTEIHRDR